jgi:SAM-dependent methyltransferase
MTRLLLEEGKGRPYSGQALLFGRQHVYFGLDELREWARLHDAQLSAAEPYRLSNIPELAQRGCIDDHTLFHALGFGTVETTDYSDYEGADIVMDLNVPAPEAMHDRYDLILDAGTLEHVYHVPNVMANIHDMLRVGGRIIHGAPTSNFVDHGFYQFSPTFFYDFYTSNGYQIDRCYLVELFPEDPNRPWNIHAFEPGAVDHLLGRLNGMFATYFAATKTIASTGRVVPQQGAYRRQWERNAK